MKTLGLIKSGEVINGFIARSVYLNYKDNPYGGRFVHEASGLSLDVIYFNSVPQASICFDTLPVSDRGEPHALEHIVLGKGAKGRRLALLEDMSLCESTAATYPDVTAYQFNTAAGMAGFYKLLSAYLDTLLKPDFTDEEAAQELYGAGVNSAGGRLSLEEIGTVYNEMAAESEKPYYTSWRQLAKAVYGKRHPLALESGGAPEALRGMTASHIRDFHGLRYAFGPNMRIIVGLPLDVGLKGFLGRLNSVISGFLPAQGFRKPPLEPRFPAFRPGSEKTLIGRYPAADLNAAQDVILAWAPRPGRNYAQLLELSTLMALLADGETSYLYRDLVDAKSRKLDFGISGVSFFVEDYPSGLAGIFLNDMALANVTARGLGKLRETVQERVNWLAGGGQDAGRAARERALALLASRKKTMLRFAETQPRFGDRGGGIAWHKHLDILSREPGFLKSVSGLKEIDRLISRINTEPGIWKRAGSEAGLLEPPYVCAVRPDAALLKTQKLQKETRIKRLEQDLLKKNPGRALPAILKSKLDADAARNSRIEKRRAKLAAPPFVKNPPLILDDTLSLKTRRIGAGVKAVAAQAGATPFLDIGLYFKVNTVSEAEIIYLPAVVSALTGVGVFTPRGEELDYAAMIERSRADILSLSSFVSANPAKGRTEIALGASCGPGETAKAVEWLENCLFRSALSGAKAGRLIDMISEQISGVRNMMQQREEYWAGELASSVFHSGNPVFMALRSPFTELFLLERLRWRLEAPVPKTKGIISALNRIQNAAAAGARAEIKELVCRLPGELKTQFEWYLCRVPESVLCRDVRKMAGYLAADLNYSPNKAVLELKALIGRICGAENLRIAVTGDAKATGYALELLKTAVARLAAQGKRVKCPAHKNTAAINIKWSGPDIKKTVHAGVVNSGGKSGVIVVSASGVAYSDNERGSLADFLAIKLLGGSGPHGLFARTCNAGLAYSNGIGANPASGRFGYYAERCPDLEATMKFVADSVKRTEINTPFLVDYALANSFSDYRGTQDNSSKGHAAACDMEDGITPASVKKFKTALLAFARNKTAALKLLRAHLPGAAARVIPGVGRPFPADGSVCAFVCGPEELLAKYENYLKFCGETAPLARLCPSDFWLTGRG